MFSFEPLRKAGGVTALVTAVLGVLVAFGLPLSEDQQKAILALAAVVGPMVVAEVGRRKVSPANAEGDFSKPEEAPQDDM